MARRIARRALGLVTAFLCMLPLATACGPTFPEASFVSKSHPDLPLDSYAAGQLGILIPTYDPSYLAVAYRYLSGQPFSPLEQKKLVNMWNNKLFAQLDTAAGPQTTNVIFAPTGNYESYANCLEDAIKTAEATRAARVQEFGEKSAAVASWSMAQEKVFYNCGHPDAANPTLPDPAESTLPDIIRRDRDYQFAAAYFYSGDLTEAKKRFLAIAADSASPWRATAALVAVRCDIREATLGTDDPAEKKQKFAAADEDLKKIIADQALTSVRASAERLHGFVAYRVDAVARAVEIARALDSHLLPDDFQSELADYNDLLSARFFGPNPEALRSQSAMTDWILSFRGGGAASEQHSVMKWEQDHSAAWLVAALAGAREGDPKLAELLDAASKIATTSAAFETVSFYRDRLLIVAGQTNEGRTNIDQLLAIPREHLTTSTRNTFLGLRMKTARNLEEFLEFAPRDPIGIVDSLDIGDPELCDRAPNECVQSKEPMLDSDAAMVFTEAMPTQMLVRAVQSSRLPNKVRFELAEVAWLRSMLLNEERLAGQISPTLSTAAPDLANFLKSYNAETTAAGRRFAAAFLILHRPEMRLYIPAGVGRDSSPGEVDSYRDNWWCSGGTAPRQQDAALSGPTEESPEFVDRNDRQIAAAEWGTLMKVDAAPDWLGGIVVGWATTHRADPRVPEALHLVVTAGHLGCKGSNTATYSKKAFALLHERYPKSEWAMVTPYWYQ